MKVVIATDGHPAANHAIREAIRLLPLANAEVLLVSVVEPEARIGANEDADQDLTQGLEILACAGVKASSRALRGHFAEQIVLAATELGADVIVMGTVGRGRLSQFLIGSVSQEVIHLWRHGAVLVVPCPEF